jgi:hypothetical protein
MAPHAEEAITAEYHTQSDGVTKSIGSKFSSAKESAAGTAKSRPRLSDKYEPGRVEPLSDEDNTYDHLRPSFPEVHWKALEETPYEDKGLLGDPRFRNLLDAADEVFDYVPKIGTELTGIRLSQLTDAQKNDLARLVATRGVVFFRNQADFDIEAQRELGRYFGTLHRHATTSMPQKEGLDDVHVIYTTDQSLDQRALFTPAYLWHSDVSSASRVFESDYSNHGQGHLRGSATVVYLSQSAEWSPTRWRRRYAVVLPVCYL